MRKLSIAVAAIAAVAALASVAFRRECLQGPSWIDDQAGQGHEGEAYPTGLKFGFRSRRPIRTSARP